MRYLLFAFLAFGLLSCGPKKSEKLFEEVMALHDEVMPKIGELRKLETELTSQKEELLANDSTADVSNIDSKLTAVQGASNGMMDWMRGFKSDELDNMQESDKVAYLKEEKKKISKVNQDIKSVLGIEEK